MSKSISLEIVQPITKKVIAEELALWFLKRGTEPVSKKEAAIKIKEFHKKMSGEDREINEAFLQNVISHVRTILEVDHKKTVISIIKYGYKLGTPREAALQGVRIYKSFLSRAERVERIMPLIERKYLPEAIEEGFRKSKELFQKFNIGSGKLLLDMRDQNGKVSREKAST